MIKWFAYIVVILVFAPHLLSAHVKINDLAESRFKARILPLLTETATDTTKNKKPDQDDKKIKEVAKAKRQPKPEKVEPAPKPRQKRQRRPEGLERPPEIPRRSGG